MKTEKNAAKAAETAASIIDIELLALDLNNCTLCVGTLKNIKTAIDIVRPVVEGVGMDVRVQRIVIATEEQARRYQFATSPTVRINGNDIVFDTLESECESCTDLCGCEEGTSCRLWRYRNEEHTEAPVGLLVESILREVLGSDHAERGARPQYSDSGVPENLRRFFASKSRSHARPTETCCSPAEAATCCDPEEKSSCCESSQPESCDCR